jgi:hypothetical protein
VPLGIYVISRIIGALYLSIGASRQAELANHPMHYVYDTVPEAPGYWGVMANWDGQWYKSIALDGYPTRLPEVGGQVVQNEWAFYPLFPTLTRAVMQLIGARFEVAAGLLSLLCGAIAMILLYRLMRQRMSTFASAATIAALCSFPTAPVLQVAYSESLTLLLLVLVLTMLQSRRYGLFAGLVLVLSLARPIALPLLLVTALHWVARWRNNDLPLSPRSRVTALLTVVVTAASATLWPLIAWASTGERRAFFATQEAWRLTTDESFIAASLLGQAIGSSGPILGAAAAAPLVCFLVLSLRGSARLWGLELRAWVVLYPTYIMLATQPTFSVLRYLLLALVPWWPFPELGERANERRVRRLFRWSVLALIVSAGFVAQYFWVTRVFTLDIGPAHQSFP